MHHKNDLQPPRAGATSDPVLYGVAHGLAELFPPVDLSGRPIRDEGQGDGGEPAEDGSED
ncbi:hypothetical protein ACLBXP_00495 [Methylobacterium sp. A54F]